MYLYVSSRDIGIYFLQELTFIEYELCWWSGNGYNVTNTKPDLHKYLAYWTSASRQAVILSNGILSR